MQMDSKTKSCRICGHEVRFIPVANSPIAGYKCDSLEESLRQKTFAMNFLFCPCCCMLQYEYFSEAGEILDRLYREHNSTYYHTETMSRYLDGFVEKLAGKYKICNSGAVLEIGCSDSRLLSMIKEKTGCEVIGVEPSGKFTAQWRQNGIQVINDYFNERAVEKLKDIRMSLIIARHVAEHIPAPVSFFGNIGKLVNPDTTVIVEVPYLKTILERGRIDNIGYSHLNYFSLRSMDEILKKNDMGIWDFSLEETDGGSILFHIKKGISTEKRLLDQILLKEILGFIDSIDKTKIRISNKVKKYSATEIVGYGAGAKGSHLIYILGLQDALEVVVDDTPDYRDRYIPGTNLQIKSPGYLNHDFVKAVINLAPTHWETIRAKVPGELDFIDIFQE